MKRAGFGRAQALVMAASALMVCCLLTIENAHAHSATDGESAEQHAGSPASSGPEVVNTHAAASRSRSKRHRILFFGGVAALFLMIAGAVGANDRHKRQPR